MLQSSQDGNEFDLLSGDIRMIHLLLWAGQVVLAIKLITVTFTHGIRPDGAKMQRGQARFGALARPLLVIIALVAFIAALAVTLAPLAGLPGSLVVWTAAFVALFMLLGIGLHLRCQEKPKPFVGVILALIAAAVAYGRGVIAPF
jgi:hypothetical protein